MFIQFKATRDGALEWVEKHRNVAPGVYNEKRKKEKPVPDPIDKNAEDEPVSDNSDSEVTGISQSQMNASNLASNTNSIDADASSADLSETVDMDISANNDNHTENGLNNGASPTKSPNSGSPGANLTDDMDISVNSNTDNHTENELNHSALSSSDTSTVRQIQLNNEMVQSDGESVSDVEKITDQNQNDEQVTSTNTSNSGALQLNLCASMSSANLNTAGPNREQLNDRAGPSINSSYVDFDNGANQTDLNSTVVSINNESTRIGSQDEIPDDLSFETALVYTSGSEQEQKPFVRIHELHRVNNSEILEALEDFTVEIVHGIEVTVSSKGFPVPFRATDLH